MQDSLRRDDINLNRKSSKVAATSKLRTTVKYCALVNGFYASNFHSKKRANRAIRLLKHYGKDAYLGSMEFKQ